MALVASEIAARLMIVGKFPGLASTPFEITSQPTTQYNCIAWAAGDNQNFWWPGAFWPKTVGRKVTRDNFIRAFQTVGYKVCNTSQPEDGFEKVALYEANGEPTHAAKLQSSGLWSSKLGNAHDISHTLDGLNGTEYGAPVLFMKRALKSSSTSIRPR